MGKFKKKNVQLKEASYTCERIIGRGQFGLVYEAKPRGKKRDGTKLPKKVAIKEFFYQRFNDPATGNNLCEEYWNRELKCTEIQGHFPAAQLKLLDYGVIGTQYYLVLTYIDGISLRDWFSRNYQKQNQLEEQECRTLIQKIILPIARHLSYVHKKGIVHRDLTIDNILIRAPKKEVAIPVIIDWGAAKIRDPNDILYPKPDYLLKGSSNSTAFMNKGTPPEIILGKEPLAASDIYMLGHIMYFLLTGGKSMRTPATHEDYILHPSLINPNVPKELEELVEKCTQYEPIDRFHNMDEIVKILEDLEFKISPTRVTHFATPLQIAIQQKANRIQKLTPQSTPVGSGIRSIFLRIGSGTKSNTSSATANPPTINASNIGDTNNPQNSILSTSSEQRATPTAANKKFNNSFFGQNFPNPHQISQNNSTTSAYATVNNITNDGSVAVRQAQSTSVGISSIPKINNKQQLKQNQLEDYSDWQSSISFIHPTASTNAEQYAKSFLMYFTNPRWEYQRQDYIQYYYTFFQEVLKSWNKKTTLISGDQILGNVYYIGRLFGSLDEVRIIGNYIQKVLQRAPTTKFVFLGDYFGFRTDLECFTYILSLSTIYPNNVILLRSGADSPKKLKKSTLKTHLKLKFGKYANYLNDLLFKLILHMDLLHVSILSKDLNILATGGGIPYLPSKPIPTPSLKYISSRLVLPFISEIETGTQKSNFDPTQTDDDEIFQTILWGEPNESADQHGPTSKGTFYFSWTQLNNFNSAHNIHFLVRPAEEPQGYRLVWNRIANINSTCLKANKPKYEAKIVRINAGGVFDLAINDLKLFFDKEYN